MISEAVERFERGEANVEESREMLVRANQGLVHLIAKRHLRQSNLRLEDLVQEGYLGLLHAADKFDPKFGCRFSTYAAWWIRAWITRTIVTKGSVMVTSEHMFRIRRKMNRAHKKLRQMGRECTPRELAAEVGVTLAKVEEVLRLPREPISMDTPIGENGRCLEDLLVDEKETPVVMVAMKRRKEDAETLLTLLSPRDRAILRMRFGLDGEGEKSLSEVGEVFSLTKERIRQIEELSLRKLRKCRKANEMRDTAIEAL